MSDSNFMSNGMINQVLRYTMHTKRSMWVQIQCLTEDKMHPRKRLALFEVAFRRCTLVSLIVVVLTSLVLMWIAMYHTPNSNFDNNRPETAEQSSENETEPVNTTVVPFKCVVFDALHHKGSLEFLDVLPPDWKVIVVNADNQKVDMASCNKCAFFSDEMARLYYEAQHNELLTASFTANKMAVYRFVFSKGANWVYTTDTPRAIPYRALNRVLDRKEEITNGIVYAGPSAVYEPCSHFVDPFAWPGQSHGRRQQDQFLLQSVSNAGLYYVVNECYRPEMKRDMSDYFSKELIDTRGPVAFTDMGTFAALDFNNVLVSRDTAWTLIASLPSQVFPDASLSEIKLKYNLAVQRLLWESGTHIGFVPSELVSQERCLTCLIKERFNEIGIDFKTNMANWRCQESLSIPDCLMDFVLDNLQEFFLNESIAVVFDTWVKWIKEGLMPPAAERSPITNKKWHEAKTTGLKVFFTPSKSIPKIAKEKDLRLTNPFLFKCDSGDDSYRTVIPGVYIFNTILLIVTLKGPQQKSIIPLLEYQYGRYFQYIVYCTMDAGQLNRMYNLKKSRNPISIIHVDRMDLQTYACVKAAINMNFDVVGYLHVSYRVLINLWNFHGLPTDQIWIQKLSDTVRLNLKEDDLDDHVKDTALRDSKVRLILSLYPAHEIRRIVSAFRYLEGLKEDSYLGNLVTDWFARLEAHAHCAGCVVSGRSDIFYLTAKLAPKFLAIMNVFSTFRAPLSVAIPSTLAGLANDSGIFTLPGVVAPPDSLSLYRKMFDSKGFYFKINDQAMIVKKMYSDFYCQDSIPSIHKKKIKKARKGPFRVNRRKLT